MQIIPHINVFISVCVCIYMYVDIYCISLNQNHLQIEADPIQSLGGRANRFFQQNVVQVSNWGHDPPTQ